MICPRCRSEPIVVETEGVELDWCPSCGGVWFDAGEIEVLLACERPIEAVLGPAPAGAPEPKLRCPRCSRTLDKVGLGEVVLDSCPDNHGIWFDAGELTSLADAAKTEEARAVLAHVIATFGKKGDD